jgi:hypothetical protein
MPSGVSDYGCQSWLGSLFGVYAPITDYWLALCSEDPGPAADGVILAALEPPPASNYARQPYGTGDGNWVVDGGYLTNLVEVVFPLPHTDWGRLSHYALADSAQDGELYAWGAFTNPQNVTTGYSMSIPVGGIVLSLSSLENSISV